MSLSTVDIAQDRVPVLWLPRLVVSSGTIEATKWLAMLLMLGDHINKYLLAGTAPALFDAGRLSLPLFAFAFAYNLARPDVFNNGTSTRVLTRLALYGLVATVPFVSLGGLGWGWWPLNIMFMFASSTLIMGCWVRGGWLPAVAAVLLFVVGGALVEFWWPGILLCLACWRYCKQPSLAALVVWLAALALLFVINHNFWALLTVPIIFLLPRLQLGIKRIPRLFYWFYPVHLAVIWAISVLIP